MPDIMDYFFGVYGASKLGSLSGLQADSDRRITSVDERLSQIEARYERLHVVTIALWALLKERTGITDEDLKRHLAAIEASATKTPGAGTMNCGHCGRVIKSSATRCLYCGSAVSSGDAFKGT